MRGTATRRWIPAIVALTAVAAGALSIGPAGRWHGSTDMAHGKLRVELSPHGDGWTARAIVGSTDLDGDGVAVDSLRVNGDSVRFAFDLDSPMGRARVGMAGRFATAGATGTITLSAGGVVVDQGTWTADRVGSVP